MQIEVDRVTGICEYCERDLPLNKHHWSEQGEIQAAWICNSCNGVLREGCGLVQVCGSFPPRYLQKLYIQYKKESWEKFKEFRRLHPLPSGSLGQGWSQFLEEQGTEPRRRDRVGVRVDFSQPLYVALEEYLGRELSEDERREIAIYGRESDRAEW